MDKEALRARLRQERQSIPLPEVIQKSQAIASRVLAELDWHSIHTMHVYSSVDEWREVDTKELIRKVQHFWPQVRIVSPSIDRDNPIPVERFDLIVAPVLGFDSHHNRIGLGGGWYDKFMLTQPDALKIGLAYESALIAEGIRPEAHDISLDKIITEIKTY